MKNYFIMTSVIVLLLLFTPLITLTNKTLKSNTESKTIISTTDESDSRSIEVIRVNSDKTEEINIKDYIIGSVAYEMPASFHAEALKAQAVACYTYAKYMQNKDVGTITDDSKKHQGYLSDEELKEKWGEKYSLYYSKIESAVEQVLGQYLTYNGEPILAAYHALSAGETNSSYDNWNEDLPYLISVSAPGDKLSENADTTVTYTDDEFIKLLKNTDGITVPEKCDSDTIADIKHNKNGYVIQLTVENMKLTGSQAREIFGLNSTNFTYEFEKGAHIFKVKGKGHGVGMSQYSADFMARQGSDYKEILAHFYQNTVLESE